MTSTQRAPDPAVDPCEHPAPTLLGVINVSPESMVRDSIASDTADVLARARRHRELGVSIVDVGGRSITPDAPPIDDAHEQARLAPAVEALVGAGERVSVDTWSSETAIVALSWGARMINFTGEVPSPELLDAVAGVDASLALTYMPYGDAYQMRGRPRVPYRVEGIVEALDPQVGRARRAGVRDVIVDPNLGIIHPDTDDFEKIHLQLEVLWNADVLRQLGCPLLLYAARKPERLARIMMAAAVLKARPEYVRTHEPETLEALLRAERETST